MNDRQLLELIVRLLEGQTKLLEEIRDELVEPETFYPVSPTAGSITVRS
jgi:hypothetical protein